MTIIDNCLIKVTYSDMHPCENCFTIPDFVTRIDSKAFASCYGLETIVIPESVKNISKTAFVGCNSLKYVRNHSSIPIVGLDTNQMLIYDGDNQLEWALSVFNNVINQIKVLECDDTNPEIVVKPLDELSLSLKELNVLYHKTLNQSKS